MSLSSYMFNPPPKPPGWCEQQGVEHSWQTGATLTVDPPIETRFCVNCGKRQMKRPAAWDDAP